MIERHVAANPSTQSVIAQRDAVAHRILAINPGDFHFLQILCQPEKYRIAMIRLSNSK